MRISAAQIFVSIWTRMCRTGRGSICKRWIKRNSNPTARLSPFLWWTTFDRYYKKQDEPYLETREREEQIVTAVENAMNRTLPVYLAGCMVGIAQITPQVAVAASEPEDADLDWDFLGE